ncbi:hypothetical protein ACFO4P_04810 [Epilithonimonas pallida]|uniref:Uncharacterized protein n=1 Tax=Epilithonimonas pallida TaxID=373671 RepID=A0ABY1QZS3_9FLAO|nr:hypothetical protein [Epilithonimonas pallida]SMP90212.1 hypothetical protein SAMN05421679_102228 [Epilithonimonas pallida]
MKNLIFLLLCIVICCSRDNDTETDNTSQLPAETQTGANTFGCLVNGKLFYPRDGSFSTAGSANAVTWWGDTSEGSNLYRELDVNNFKDGKPINNFWMHLQDIPTKGTGEYIWMDSNFKHGIDGLMQNYVYVKAFDYNTSTWKWYTSYENSGKTIITKYGGQPIVSGTFSGKLRSADGKETIEIIDGRFDINTATIGNQNFP